MYADVVVVEGREGSKVRYPCSKVQAPSLLLSSPQIPCGFSAVRLWDSVNLRMTAVVCDPGDFYALTKVRVPACLDKAAFYIR